MGWVKGKEEEKNVVKMWIAGCGNGYFATGEGGRIAAGGWAGGTCPWTWDVGVEVAASGDGLVWTLDGPLHSAKSAAL